MNLSLILLLTPASALTSSQGPDLEKDINFRSKKIHQQVEQAIRGTLVESSESRIGFGIEPFKLQMLMKF